MKRILTRWRWAGVLIGIFLVYAAAIRASLSIWPLPTAALERDYSTVSLGPDGRLLRIALSPRGTYRIRLPLSDISESLQREFLQSEDQYFFHHPGVNPMALARSAWCDLRRRRIVMGGSTLTMQIAKLMEPKPRTVRSKLIEIARALQLETRYSKAELLEIYLNMVPMGGNIEGVGAASYLYFGKAAADLGPGESALLVGLPRAPSRFRPDRHAARAEALKTKMLIRLGSSAPSAVVAGPAGGRRAGRYANPFECPHLLMRTRSLGSPYIKHYTIDARIQAMAESRLREAVRGLKPAGVSNGAVLVVDNATMRVLAYVGSPDFHDAAHGGQINGARIERSPGSLLKPFLYGAAIEKGLLTPKMLVYDIERNYDGYVPANFDRNFSGPVAAEEALARSLNVPAVNLEYEMGKDGLASVLRRARLMDDERARRAPGLSLVLGAYPLNLEELVRLYAAIAGGGRFRDLVFFEEDRARPNAGIPLFKPETCFIVAEMLSKLERPDLPQSWEFTPNRGKIAFKTGTSFGLRDAWSIGMNPRYTIGVWLGNADSRGSSALVGIKAAAPVVVSLFNDLTRYGDSWFPKPAGVLTRDVCALSGEPAGPDCPSKVTDYFIPGVSPSATCRLHHRIMVRRSDGKEVCSACMTGPRRSYVAKIVEDWPPDVATFLRAHGDARATLPPHNPDCKRVAESGALKVRSPLPGGFYAATPALPPDAQRIPLMAQSQSGLGTLYWYLDDVLVGAGQADRVFYIQPVPGSHQIRVMDWRGHYDVVSFNVRRSL
ncbi:MAG TPA: penicillin-binding protein 1C [Elusimicrobiota bacterium]|nr:penicillin-binding protein 1C [Elusimicrobiota bacterium]